MGTTKKKFSGALRRIGAPTYARDRCPHFQIRSGATDDFWCNFYTFTGHRRKPWLALTEPRLKTTQWEHDSWAVGTSITWRQQPPYTNWSHCHYTIVSPSPRNTKLRNKIIMKLSNNRHKCDNRMSNRFPSSTAVTSVLLEKRPEKFASV